MLSEEEKKEVKENFKAWVDIQDTKKELAQESKSLIKNSSNILNVKSTVVTKLFKELQKRLYSGDSDFDSLNELINELSD